MAFCNRTTNKDTSSRSFWAAAVSAFLLNMFAGDFLMVYAQDSEETTFYVRSTVGQDYNSGTSPESAFQTVTRGARDLGPGDTLIIGPGIYRETVRILQGGLPGQPVRVVGDPSGRYTGDPPGAVLMAGSVPVDESIFEPEGTPGVFKVKIPEYVVTGAVEMDGLQYRYRNVREPESDVPYVDRVRKEPGTLWYERETSTFYIHTRDKKHPDNHDFELVRYHSAINTDGKQHVWISGLTLRHFTDGAIVMRDGSDYGRVYNVTAIGSRQGIRVRDSKYVQVLNNVLIRNENSGVYFYQESMGGLAMGNVAYENDVGIRFGSNSSAALALDNLVIDNKHAGISFEALMSAVASHNSLKGNTAQFRIYKTTFSSDHNCFEASNESGQIFGNLDGGPVSDPALALKDNWLKIPSLAEFSKEYGQGLNSREGDCDISVNKMDLQLLHEETLNYADRAREILGKE